MSSGSGGSVDNGSSSGSAWHWVYFGIDGVMRSPWDMWWAVPVGLAFAAAEPTILAE